MHVQGKTVNILTGTAITGVGAYIFYNGVEKGRRKKQAYNFFADLTLKDWKEKVAMGQPAACDTFLSKTRRPVSLERKARWYCRWFTEETFQELAHVKEKLTNKKA